VHTEIESLAALHAHVAAGRGWRDVVVQGLDLTGETPLITHEPVEGAVFLGCAFTPAALTHVQATGGIVFPRLPGLAWDPARAQLYTVDELMQGATDERTFFTDSRDARIYAQYQRTRDDPPILEALAQRLHDHAIDDALGDLLAARARVVAFMGGHAMARTDPFYADVARCARALAREDYFVITGGGPGAMEAANLGAFLAPCEDGELDAAIARLKQAPAYTSPGWIATARTVRALAGERHGATLGVPTWFYGHEPTNFFCTHVAKYFSNAIREDGLLAIARDGVVFAPGGPGTVQEIFMDACQNHYGTYGAVSPMAFLGRKYWCEDRPVFPLLAHLARGAQYEPFIGVFDAPNDVVAFLRAHPPVAYRKS
jgi:predicted Rossmann-fold nucleotide-binding protein